MTPPRKAGETLFLIYLRDADSMELKCMSRYESLLTLPPLREKRVSLLGHTSPDRGLLECRVNN